MAAIFDRVGHLDHLLDFRQFVVAFFPFWANGMAVAIFDLHEVSADDAAA